MLSSKVLIGLVCLLVIGLAQSHKPKRQRFVSMREPVSAPRTQRPRDWCLGKYFRAGLVAVRLDIAKKMVKNLDVTADQEAFVTYDDVKNILVFRRNEQTVDEAIDFTNPFATPSSFFNFGRNSLISPVREDVRKREQTQGQEMTDGSSRIFENGLGRVGIKDDLALRQLQDQSITDKIASGFGFDSRSRLTQQNARNEKEQSRVNFREDPFGRAINERSSKDVSFNSRSEENSQTRSGNPIFGGVSSPFGTFRPIEGIVEESIDFPSFTSPSFTSPSFPSFSGLFSSGILGGPTVSDRRVSNQNEGREREDVERNILENQLGRIGQENKLNVKDNRFQRAGDTSTRGIGFDQLSRFTESGNSNQQDRSSTRFKEDAFGKLIEQKTQGAKQFSTNSEENTSTQTGGFLNRFVPIF